MLVRWRFAMLALLAALGLFGLAPAPELVPPASAGVVSSPPAPLSYTGGSDTSIIWISVPDVQNIVSTYREKGGTNESYDEARSRDLAMKMVGNIGALKPAFVLFEGDLTDTTGGTVQGDIPTISDDPNSAGTIQDKEWQRFQSWFWQPLENAGFQLLAAVGNHDSCVDYERYVPVASFQAKPYYYSHQARAGNCGGTYTDTIQRAALMSTPIGEICVVATRMNGDATDATWVNGAIGCGASKPTILLTHYTVASAVLSAVGNTEVVESIAGHVVPCGLFYEPATGGGRTWSYLRIVANWQEQRIANAAPCVGPDTFTPSAWECQHTGLGYFVVHKLTPKQNKLEVWAIDSVMGTTLGYPGSAESATPVSYTFSPTWCSEFGGGGAYGC